MSQKSSRPQPPKSVSQALIPDRAITTRPFIIEALVSDGEAFRIERDAASIYTMPLEKRSGVYTKGIYFWHDFPMAGDKKSLSDDWEQAIANVNDKYQKKWIEFRKIMRSQLQKHIILSNAQSNLEEFAPDAGDFAFNFGLTEVFLYELIDKLNQWDAKQFRITFLVRTLAEYEAIIKARSRLPDVFIPKGSAADSPALFRASDR